MLGLAGCAELPDETGEAGHREESPGIAAAAGRRVVLLLRADAAAWAVLLLLESVGGPGHREVPTAERRQAEACPREGEVPRFPPYPSAAGGLPCRMDLEGAAVHPPSC